MKKLESKLFKKFENNELKNLNFVTGGTNWQKSFNTRGQQTDYMDEDSFRSGAQIPPADYSSGSTHPVIAGGSGPIALPATLG